VNQQVEENLLARQSLFQKLRIENAKTASRSAAG
jgi:hypothetical protein